jgi:hypothetical protein
MTTFFVRTRHTYASYVDWWKLIEVSGYATCYQDELDQQNPDHTYILTHFAALGINGNEQPAKAQLILWQTEYITPERYVDYSPNIKRFWHMDAWQADVMSHEYIPIGGHPDLGYIRDKNIEPKYDIALLAYSSERRQPIFDAIKRTFTTMPENELGEARVRALWESRLMVHVHQRDPYYAISGIRMAIAAAHGLPLLCENVNNMGIYRFPIMWSDMKTSVGKFKHFLSDQPMLDDYSARLQHLLHEEYSFQKVVEGAV